MSAIPSGSKERELPSEGSQNAICIQVIDLGTQPSGEWGDKRKVQLAFECVDEQTSDDRAMVVYKPYTFTDSEKGNLMKDLKGWGVKAAGDFDMDELLNKPAILTIEHAQTDRGTFANIANIAGLPKGMKVRKATEPVRSLYLDENFDEDTFNALPEWLRNKIASSPEYAECMKPKLKKGAVRKPVAAKPDPRKAATKQQPAKRR